MNRTFLRASGMSDSLSVHTLAVDDTFTEVFDISITHGRPFRSSDRQGRYFILNQTAARQLGGAEPGSHVEAWGQQYEVIGISEDFHNASLHAPIRPLLLEPEPTFNYLTVHISTGNLEQTVSDLKGGWARS